VSLRVVARARSPLAFEAINRRDLDWLVAHCDPGVEMHIRGVAGEPVRYVGAAGIRDYLRDIAGDLGDGRVRAGGRP